MQDKGFRSHRMKSSSLYEMELRLSSIAPSTPDVTQYLSGNVSQLPTVDPISGQVIAPPSFVSYQLPSRKKSTSLLCNDWLGAQQDRIL